MKWNRVIGVFVLAITCLFVTLQSCTKLGQLLSFNLSMQTESVTITIPVTTDTTDALNIGPVTNSFNVDSFVKVNTASQLGAANIKSVKISSVVLVLDNADAANNFRDFSSFNASFYSNTEAMPYTISIPSNPDVYASTLTLPIDTTAELKSYLGNQFTYSVSGKLRHPVTKPVTCTVTFTFSVSVQG